MLPRWLPILLASCAAAPAGSSTSPPGAASSAPESPAAIEAGPPPAHPAGDGAGPPASSAAAAPAAAAPGSAAPPAAAATPGASASAPLTPPTTTCEALVASLSSADPDTVRAAAIGITRQPCSEVADDAASRALKRFVFVVDPEDDSLFNAAIIICARTRHPAVLMQAGDVVVHHMLPRFSPAIQARARSRLRSGRDC